MVELRQAQLSDEAALLPLIEAFHQEDGHPLSNTGPAAVRALLTGSALGKIFLVERGSHLVGYFALCFTMSLEFGGEVVILDDLYLIEKMRRQGIGHRILTWVEAEARARKAVQIFLEVENANLRAFHFYQEHGWKKRDRHMMEKNL